MRAGGIVSSLLLASVATIGFVSSAYSFTLNDNYYGANNTYNNQDVIGTSTFNILNAIVSRSGANNDTLNIIINTNYSGAPNTPAAEGTNYGSLFLNPLYWSVTTTTAPYTSDNFVNGNQNWAYAVTTPSTGSGSTGLFATGLNPIGASGAVAHNYLATTTPNYYTSADGKIVMSNVNGDPITYPYSGNPSYYFREGQAVQFDPTQAAIRSASVTVVNGSYIEYSIVDNGLLGNTFALSWAMTCANDVIQGLVQLGNNDLTGSTPIPATLPLFASGLGGIVLLARRRSKKTVALAVAA
jgi:hypothetical protein